MKKLYLLMSLAACLLTGAAQAETKSFPKIQKPTVSFYEQMNTFGQARYIPAQALAPYCERINENTRKNVCGIQQLAADRQVPLEDGMEFLPGSNGMYEIHYGRAGARVHEKGVIVLRMELCQQLVKLLFAVSVDGDIFPLTQFRQEFYRIYPGRAHWRLVHEEAGLVIEMQAVAPVALGAYGVQCRLDITSTRSKSREVSVLCGFTKVSEEVDFMRDWVAVSARQDIVRYDCPQENPMIGHPSHDDKRYLYDTNYQVLGGFDAPSHATANTVAAKYFDLGGGETKQAYLTAVIDSPGYEQGIVERVESFFGQNKNLPESVRKELARQALDTHLLRVVDADKRFKQYAGKPDDVFKASVQRWETGCWRDSRVQFTLPDKKLQAVANMAVNDWLPGLIQRPGLVHDAKYVDIWNYIFCYRHVHAAIDGGYEDYGLNYLRLLSNHQQENGWVRSIMANFKTPAHPTRFDASYINTAWHYFKWTGDIVAIRELFPTLENATRFIESSQDPDGDNIYSDLFNQWKSDYDDRTPNSTFQTAIVWRAYHDLAELAGVLGYTDKQDQYAKKAADIQKAAAEELWSDEMVMLCTSGPLGIKRYHPQSLEVEIPVWTGFVDQYQARVLTDWYLANHANYDRQGGIWMVDNDWWPAVWSQHVPAPGDYLMIGWALMLTGHHDEGANILQTVAGGSFRNQIPGFSYIYNPDGSLGGDDPGTVQGAWNRAIFEGLFGIKPNLDQNRIVFRPAFPADWPYAKLDRKGTAFSWTRDENLQTYQVKTESAVTQVIEAPVRNPVEKVLLNGQRMEYKISPDMGCARVCVELPKGGGKLEIYTKPESFAVTAPDSARPGEVITVNIEGVDQYQFKDPYRFFAVQNQQNDLLRLRLKKQACGRASAFLHCKKDNLEWIHPVHLWTMPKTAKEAVQRTVTEPIDDNAGLVCLDLEGRCNVDIQTCFKHRWKFDSHGVTEKIAYWSMPLFELTESLPEQLWVEHIPFKLAPMGPGEAAQTNDMIMVANTEPYSLPTGCRIEFEPAKLNKVYLLSLNMNLPQKCYIPAALVDVHYTDGTIETTELIPPVNFDSYYQDFGINTLAYPLKTKPSYGQTQWYIAFWFDLQDQHLTATDIKCNPKKTAAAIEVRSISTETFIALAGVTLDQAK